MNEAASAAPDAACAASAPETKPLPAEPAAESAADTTSTYVAANECGDEQLGVEAQAQSQAEPEEAPNEEAAAAQQESSKCEPPGRPLMSQDSLRKLDDTFASVLADTQPDEDCQVSASGSPSACAPATTAKLDSASGQQETPLEHSGATAASLSSVLQPTELIGMNAKIRVRTWLGTALRRSSEMAIVRSNCTS